MVVTQPGHKFVSHRMLSPTLQFVFRLHASFPTHVSYVAPCPQVQGHPFPDAYLCLRWVFPKPGCHPGRVVDRSLHLLHSAVSCRLPQSHSTWCVPSSLIAPVRILHYPFVSELLGRHCLLLNATCRCYRVICRLSCASLRCGADSAGDSVDSLPLAEQFAFNHRFPARLCDRAIEFFQGPVDEDFDWYDGDD